jgi:hypothetical protein
MANFNGQNVGLNYKGVLNLNTLGGDLLTNAWDKLSDGAGNLVPMKLSTTGLRFDGTFAFEKSGILGLFDYSALATANKTFTLPNKTGTFTLGTGTANELTYWVDANTIGSLSTSTYPSLTELSYIKGLTSSVQNQINNKIGLSALSASAPLSYNNLTGAFTISQATTSIDGYLSSTDWNTFNGKQNALGFTPVTNARTLNINGTTYDLSANRTWNVGTVTSVTASSPLASSGGATPNLSISQASASSDGYLSSTDWSTFNGKEPAISTLPISKGGTNSNTALSNNRVMQSSGGAIVEASAITSARALKSDANGIPTHFDTTTEPSLTELSYVKGVTSAIQTQLNARALATGVGLPTEIQLACSDETTALTIGNGKVTFRMPYAMTVTEVRASLTTAQASGSIFTVDINESGSSILSTKLTIDNTEKTSTTAATPAVISDSSLADDAEITIDIDQIGTSGATGLKILIKGTRA